MNWFRFYDQLGEFMNHTLFSIGERQFSLSSIVMAIVILAVTYLMSRLARRALRLWATGREGLDPGTVAAFNRLLHYVIMLTGIGIALDTVGVKMSALFTAGAAFAVAIGFAMQSILQNFVAGVILLLERTIKPGDVIVLDGEWVRVQKMSIRTTVVRTRNEEDVIVPNSILAQSSVRNLTMRDNIARIRAVVGVSYDSDMRQVMTVLAKAAQGVHGRLQTQEPLVLLTDFGDSTVNFDVSIWTEDPWDTNATKSTLNEAIWWALKDAGISIAYPQIDVHMSQVEKKATTFGVSRPSTDEKENDVRR